MAIIFDEEKLAANLAKHGVSFQRVSELNLEVVIEDRRRNYGEPRYRGFGLLDWIPHCLAFTYRGADLRVISFRRAHLKEYRRHVR